MVSVREFESRPPRPKRAMLPGYTIRRLTGGSRGNQTPDLDVKSILLYLLSYAPETVGRGTQIRTETNGIKIRDAAITSYPNRNHGGGYRIRTDLCPACKTSALSTELYPHVIF